MAARMQSQTPVTKAEYKSFIKSNTLNWTKSYEDFYRSFFAKFHPAFDTYLSGLPDNIYLISTTGIEEGNSEYTRDNAYHTGQLKYIVAAVNLSA